MRLRLILFRQIVSANNKCEEGFGLSVHLLFDTEQSIGKPGNPVG
jgi:hypothetical protein